MFCIWKHHIGNSDNIYLFKVNNRNNKICSNLNKYVLEICSGVFEHFTSVSMVDFEQVNVSLEDATDPHYDASCQIQNHRADSLSKTPAYK